MFEQHILDWLTYVYGQEPVAYNFGDGAPDYCEHVFAYFCEV